MAINSSLIKLLREHHSVALDTNVFIYRLQNTPSFQEEVGTIFEWIRSSRRSVMTSIITLLEMSVKIFQQNREDKIPTLLEFLSGDGRIKLVDVDRAVALKAAALRAQYRFSVADSIQIATAVCREATLFLTADRELKVAKVENVLIHLLQA